MHDINFFDMTFFPLILNCNKGTSPGLREPGTGAEGQMLFFMSDHRSRRITVPQTIQNPQIWALLLGPVNILPDLSA